MPIGKLFHFMQIVDDFDAAEAAYDKLLAPQVYMPKSWSDFDKRWASLAVVGPDFVLELMEPSTEEADQGQPLPKFHARHGEHLHSLSWLVDADDFLPLARRARDAGIRVITPYGSLDPTGDEPGAQTFFTHPKDTFGQLEFQSFDPDGGHNSPHTAPGWTGDWWRDQHPLGLLGTSHLTTVVSDLDEARTFYAKVLEADVFHTETTDDRRSVFALVGVDTVVEIAQPTTSDSRLARDLAEHGQLPHAMTFRVADLAAAADHVTGQGFTIAERTDDTITVEPSQLHGAVVAFTTRELPDDPRLR